MKRTARVIVVASGAIIAGSLTVALRPDLATCAHGTLAQHEGTILLTGLNIAK